MGGWDKQIIDGEITKEHGYAGPGWRNKQHERCFWVSLVSEKWSAAVSCGRWIVLHGVSLVGTGVKWPVVLPLVKARCLNFVFMDPCIIVQIIQK